MAEEKKVLEQAAEVSQELLKQANKAEGKEKITVTTVVIVVTLAVGVYEEAKGIYKAGKKLINWSKGKLAEKAIAKQEVSDDNESIEEEMPEE